MSKEMEVSGGIAIVRVYEIERDEAYLIIRFDILPESWSGSIFRGRSLSSQGQRSDKFHVVFCVPGSGHSLVNHFYA